MAKLLAFNSDAKFEASEGEGGVKIDRFNMLAYTGGPMELEGWRLPVVVDIEGMRVPKSKRPVLLNHDTSQIVGHTDEVTKLNGQLIVKGVASGASAATAQVSASSKQGFPWQASIGAAAKRWVEVKEGKTAKANGREWEGPIFVVRQSVLGEISFVPLGADGDTEAKFAAKKAASKKGSAMDFEAFVESLGLVASDLTAEQTTSFKTLHAAQVKASADGDGSGDGDGEGGGTATKTKPAKAAKSTESDSDDSDDSGDVDAIQARRKVEAEEAHRIGGIRKIAAKYPTLDFEAKAIEEGWTVDKSELHAMRETMPKAPAIAGSGAKGGPAVGKAIEASMLLQAGRVDEKGLEKWYKSEEIEAALSKDYRRAGISDLIHLVCSQNGVHIRAGRITDDSIRSVLNVEQRVRASGSSQSTISLDGILGNVANKSLMTAYLAVARTVDELCGVKNLGDFKVHTSYRMTASGILEEVGTNGELKHTTESEESYTAQLKTYGRMIVLDRKHIINDDLGAFLEIPQQFGRMSALSVEKAFYTLLLANTGTFFGSGNLNYQEGSTTVLSVDSLSAAVQLFYDQKDTAGYPISLLPNRILVPSGLMVPAQQLFKDEFFSVPTTSTKKESVQNPHRGVYTPIVSPWLNTSTITGYSTTAWYLFANPADVPAFVVGYLNGNRTPTIESGEANFNTLGMGWRCFFDFGFGQGDKRAAVKSKGAA